MDGFVESIKQYPGQQQVDRSVKVKVPGKHFPQLQALPLLSVLGAARTVLYLYFQ